MKLDVSNVIDNPSANPKINEPIKIPNGSKFPKKHMANAIQPRPPIMLLVYNPKKPIE